MPIEITLERRQLQLTSTEAALAKAATSRHALRRQFDSAIALAEPYRPVTVTGIACWLRATELSV